MVKPSDVFLRRALTASSADFVVGRRLLIKNIANRLAEDRVSAVIYGARGVGKTTIAWQVLSVLEGVNPRFKRDDFLVYGKERRFRTIFHKCPPEIQTIGDLLIGLILDPGRSHSFRSEFPSIFEDEESIRSIKTKFGVDLLKVFQFEEVEELESNAVTESAKQHLSEERAKRNFFFEVLQRASTGKEDLVIVIDEMERSKIKGLGSFIKDIDEVQFVFVGIADTIADLIEDHRSAGRKLSGTDFEAPLLEPSEIEEIFDIAERHSRGALSVTGPFRQLVVEYAGGVPWIAQHVGHEAFFQKSTDSALTGAPVRLESEDFPAAIRSVTRIYERDLDFGTRLEELESMGLTEIEILKIVWKHQNGVAETDLRTQVPSHSKRFFDRGLIRLEEAKVLVRRGRTLRFPDPTFRVLVKYFIDKA